MKTISKFFFLMLIAFTAFFFQSCEDANETLTSTSPAVVKFSAVNLGLSELAGATDITIVFSKPAVSNGAISITLNSGDEASFTSDPQVIDGTITLPVLAGQSQVKFILNPVDNNLHTGNKNIHFTITSVTEGIVIGTEKSLHVTIFENDQPIAVNFITTQASFSEKNSEGFQVMIGLSLQAIDAGQVEIELSNATELYGTFYTTEPEMSNGKITLTVSAGMAYLPIKFIPVNNSILQGHKEIIAKIISATGAVSIGNQINLKLTLLDDELEGKPLSYETGAGLWKVKRSFEYNELGQISRVQNEQNSLSWTDTYHYDQNNLLTKISSWNTDETLFLRDQQNRIVRSEEFREGIRKKYSMYTYDQVGNVGEIAVFHLQASGEFTMSSLHVYLYYSNSNALFKKLTYYPLPNGEYELITEEEYAYMANNGQINPFPMVTILPGINAQPLFPRRYVLKRDGKQYDYTMDYEFNSQGLPIRRTTGSEVTTYHYY